MVGKMGTAQVGTNEVEYGIIRSYLAASNVRRLDNIYIYYTIYIYILLYETIMGLKKKLIVEAWFIAFNVDSKPLNIPWL